MAFNFDAEIVNAVEKARQKFIDNEEHKRQRFGEFLCNEFNLTNSALYYTSNPNYAIEVACIALQKQKNEQSDEEKNEQSDEEKHDCDDNYHNLPFSMKLSRCPSCGKR